MTFPDLWSPEFRIGFAESGFSFSNSLGCTAGATLTDGRIVVASYRYNAGIYTIKAQVLNADGTLAGDPFDVAQVQPGSNPTPIVGNLDIAALADGGFVIV